ncbi:unnamed protein product, partial [Rotaria sp. Silwood2]
MKKIGNAENDPSDINNTTNQVDDEIAMQFVSKKENDKEVEIKLIKDVTSILREINCHLIKASKFIDWNYR